MDWYQQINQAISFIESNLLNEITIEEVARHAFSSSAHFQRLFHLITGITIGEYIRNRRLSLAGRELLLRNSRVIDVAMKYQYDTAESFSKAFTRFHEVAPSDAKKRKRSLKFFYPLTIHISIQGGFQMANPLIDKFYWSELEKQGSALTNEEKYQELVRWAGKARGQNPGVFDALTQWILDDGAWGEESLMENEQILMEGVFARFREQNGQLRACLKELEASGVVNAAVFQALDRFDDELSGDSHVKELREMVAAVFADFSLMKERRVREQIAGNPTGSTGTNHVEYFGYINYLKDCDAGVQWALFMPDMVQRQQKGFRVESFSYKKLPAMRFVGFEGEEYADPAVRMEKMKVLDGLSAYRTELPFDALFMHHNGMCVDVGEWHGVWGRFLQADTPVPEGFLHFDLIPERGQEDGQPGVPYLAQFAYAVFSGDSAALHQREGYDSDAMYDVTRNIMLGQGVNIPYPDKYWTAEVFFDGCGKDSNGYLFSAEL